MYFFADPLKITATPGPVTYNYGPSSNTTFYTGARFDLNTPPVNNEKRTPAYACQKGHVIIVETADPALVNVVLQPLEVHELHIKPVKYYIYRGIAKDSFLDASGAVKPSNPSVNSEILENFWTNWTASIASGAIPSVTPNKKNIGFVDVVSLFVSLVDFFEPFAIAPILDLLPMFVKEGQSLGEWLQTAGVPAKPIEFEVVFDDSYEHISTVYCRAHRGEIDVSSKVQNVTNATPSLAEAEFELKKAKMRALSHIDPAAFFGMHYEVGVGHYDTAAGSSVLASKDVLYNKIISLFPSKNRVYIDIRSEWGYPYNFYDNYADGSGNNIKIKAKSSSAFTDEQYNQSHGWPVYYKELPTGSKTFIIKLRTDNNKTPLLYIEDAATFGKKKKTFIKKEKLNPLLSPAGWTANISLVSFEEGGNFIASYLRLHYLRQESSDPVNNKILKIDSDLDTYFGDIRLVSAGQSTFFRSAISSQLQLVQGDDFSYVAYPELYRDSQSAIFITRLQSNKYSNEKSEKKWAKKRVEGDLLIDDPLFPSEILFSKTAIVENTVSGNVSRYILDVASYGNTLTAQREDCLVLALTAAQHDILYSVSNSLSILHGKYVVFKEEGGSEHASVLGKPFKKYKLHVQGLDGTGTVPALIDSNIIVYSLNDYVFSSHEFGLQASIPIAMPDPVSLKQWKHVGKWSAMVQNTGVVVPDFGSNAHSFSPPFAIDYAVKTYFPTKVKNTTNPEKVGDPSNITAKYPLIVIVHGNGQKYTSYDFLLKHLAHNGFIAASIDCTIANDKATLQPIPHPVYTQLVAALEPYGYDPVREKFCKFDIISNTFPSQNELPWKKGVDFTISGLVVTFKPSIRIHGNSHGMGARGRANTLFHLLNQLRNTFKVTNGGTTTYKIANNIGLIGHSRGGEAILTAQRLIDRQDGTTSADSVVNLRSHAGLPALNNITALFSLAPTDQYEAESLNGIPHFVLYGSHDADVSAARFITRTLPTAANVFPSHLSPTTDMVSSTGFSLWERTEGAEKFMAFVRGATHNGFVTKNKDDYNRRGYFYDKSTASWVQGVNYRGQKAHTDDFVADEVTQHKLLKGFTVAFFRCYQKSESYWKILLKGEQLTSSMEHPKASIGFQYKHPNTLAVQDYKTAVQDPNPSGGEMIGMAKRDIISPAIPPPPGPVPPTSPLFIPVVIQNAAHEIEELLDFFSPHALHSRIVELGPLYPISTNRVFEVFNSTSHGMIVGLNSTGFTHLSFRLGIVFNHNINYNVSPPIKTLGDIATIQQGDLEVEFGATISNTIKKYSYDKEIQGPHRRYDISDFQTPLIADLTNSATRLIQWPNEDIQKFLTFATTKSAMVTVRIPLDDVGLSPIERGDIRSIKLHFGGASGIVAFSDFEFTN